MSQRTVNAVMDWLITDEQLRLQFTVDPLTTLAAWLNAGLQLTDADIDVLIQADVVALAGAAVPV